MPTRSADLLDYWRATLNPVGKHVSMRRDYEQMIYQDFEVTSRVICHIAFDEYLEATHSSTYRPGTPGRYVPRPIF